MNITVRLELEKDYRRVEEITREAFSYPGRIEKGGIGCPYEHWMVHALRERDGIRALSFVAEVNGEIVGHVIYSHAHIETADGNTVHVLNFGPLSVQPEYQHKGVGKALMNITIAKAKELGYGAILFFGRPEYYPQFGFIEAGKYGITDCNGNNYPAFMAMELKKGYLNGIHGKYYESAIYHDELNAVEAQDYDIKNFR
jgi:predicted N-acetyltransferase YhbS